MGSRNTERKVLSHFQKADPVLHRAATRIGSLSEIIPKPPREYFKILCREIIYQQLSDKAGGTIHGRVLSLFPGNNITAKRLLKVPGQTIRNAGTSWSKVRFLQDLARKTEDGEIPFSTFSKLEDEEVVEELMKIHGIGRWTAEMFLISALGREDVFSHGDRGLYRGIEKLYGLSNPEREAVEKITAKWSPYRTYGSRVLWGIADENMP